MKVTATRREFLKKTAATAGAALAMPYLMTRSASAQGDKLRVAVIGAGGMGGYAVGEAIREQCVAMCDIDDAKMAEALTKFSEAHPDDTAPKTYTDYRVLMDECGKDLDVVLISTPDHTHAGPALRAIDLEIPVFVQKPMAHNIRECNLLAQAATDKGVLTQMGNQGHCSETFRRACEDLWAGAVGNVTETHSLLGRNFGGTGGRPETKPVPAGVHWDEWLGPAPYRDYHDGLHAFGLKVYEAKSYTMECLNTNGGSDEMGHQENVVRFDIPARGDMPPVKVFVYDHKGLIPDSVKDMEKEFGFEIGECTVYVGDKGIYRTGGHASHTTILTPERAEAWEAPERVLRRVHVGPIENLYDGIRYGTTPVSNFPDAATPLTSFVLSGLLAQHAGVGQKVEWDVEKMECTNLPELNEHVGREYRAGWEV